MRWKLTKFHRSWFQWRVTVVERMCTPRNCNLWQRQYRKIYIGFKKDINNLKRNSMNWYPQNTRAPYDLLPSNQRTTQTKSWKINFLRPPLLTSSAPWPRPNKTPFSLTSRATFQLKETSPPCPVLSLDSWLTFPNDIIYLVTFGGVRFPKVPCFMLPFYTRAPPRLLYLQVWLMTFASSSSTFLCTS